MAPVEWKSIDNEKWFKFNSKFDNFKYFYGHWLSIILFIIVIISIIWVGLYIYTNKTAFFENPVVYGIKQMEDQNDGIISCSCVITNEDFSFDSFILNREGIHLTQ